MTMRARSHDLESHQYTQHMRDELNSTTKRKQKIHRDGEKMGMEMSKKQFAVWGKKKKQLFIERYV